LLEVIRSAIGNKLIKPLALEAAIRFDVGLKLMDVTKAEEYIDYLNYFT
jgi:hypothetical protein